MLMASGEVRGTYLRTQGEAQIESWHNNPTSTHDHVGTNCRAPNMRRSKANSDYRRITTESTAQREQRDIFRYGLAMFSRRQPTSFYYPLLVASLIHCEVIIINY